MFSLAVECTLRVCRRIWDDPWSQWALLIDSEGDDSYLRMVWDDACSNAALSEDMPAVVFVNDSVMGLLGVSDSAEACRMICGFMFGSDRMDSPVPSRLFDAASPKDDRDELMRALQRLPS